MYVTLSNKPLKTGEMMEIGVVIPPDERFADRIISFLKHKGQPWEGHIREAFAGRIPELETRFYVGCLDANVIANIMTVEYGQTGILGHVFTAPQHRRKGACKLVMAQQMADFKKRGGGQLLLATDYDSPAYWIYHSYGFRSVFPQAGFMRYATEDDFEARYFAPAPTRAVDVTWKDWPRWNVLGACSGGDYLRSIALDWWGMRNLEGGFLETRLRIQEARIQVKLLESQKGSIVGFASLQPDFRWNGHTHLLDLFVHPSFSNRLAQLLDALSFPKSKTQCYAESTSQAKVQALLAAGFRQEALFKGQVRKGSAALDVLVFARAG